LELRPGPRRSQTASIGATDFVGDPQTIIRSAEFFCRAANLFGSACLASTQALKPRLQNRSTTKFDAVKHGC